MKRPYKCPNCGVGLSKRHVQMWLETGANFYPCNRCGTPIYMRLERLAEHE